MPELDLSELAGEQGRREQPASSRAAPRTRTTTTTDESQLDHLPDPETGEGYLIDPTTGEVVDLDNADELIDCLERVEKHDQRIYACKQQIRLSLGRLAEGETKTRRVRGKRRRAKLEFPGNRWNQSILKEAWNSYPGLRDQALRIGTVDVRAREFAKMRNESGPADFEQFKGMILSAEQPGTSPPTVTIEE